jgi:hypothetical protein
MKYAIILNNEISHKYESNEKLVFGGPWGSEEALHLEVPEHLNLNILSWDGESFYERELTPEEQKAKRQQEAQEKLAKNRKDIEFGLDIIALVGSMNEDKDLSHEDKNAMMADSYISTVMIMLQAGRIGYVKQLVEAYTPTENYFTQEDKDYVLQLINDYLN